jgi:Holliday junction resolvasome RuvABC endonuclease subunit
MIDIQTYFAVDPSIRSCGWAYYNTTPAYREYIFAGLCRSKKKNPGHAALDVFWQLSDLYQCYPDHLIVERPIIEQNWTRTKTNAVTKLIAVYGMCLTLASKQTNLWTPTVPEWKGQLSKKISHKRTLETLDENSIELRYCEKKQKIPDSLEHNTLDAVALLTKYLQKKEIIT